ncbi:MAG TPA: hypothetical protein VFS39_16260 [Nitrospira sp.]|nr:hypothetical protein [Nitrospira sp.]
METPLVVDRVSSLLKAVGIIVQMVRQDMHAERPNDVTTKSHPPRMEPYRYNPAEW